MNALVNLQILSIGNNNIEKLENVSKNIRKCQIKLHYSNLMCYSSKVFIDAFKIIPAIVHPFQIVYLRHFKHLRTLNLSGNPLCQDESYKPYVVAHLSHLVYLDFRLIDAKCRESALEQYRYTIEEIVHNETLAEKQKQEAYEQEMKRKLHKVKENDIISRLS